MAELQVRKLPCGWMMNICRNFYPQLKSCSARRRIHTQSNLRKFRKKLIRLSARQINTGATRCPSQEKFISSS